MMILFVCILELKGAKLNNKKTLKTKANTQSAIIAIQIIDPHENKTSTKNSKRTIDSSLGYGYQSIFGGKQPPPRYETYKYSQHDIPPYNGSPPAQFNGGIQSQSYEIQPSVSKQIYNTDVSNHYQPGTVLFSTIDQRGQLGDLSSQFPVSLENHQYPIPVIILRVHPNQLTNPVYPKLPQNHLLASEINSIDINSLLSNYIKNNVKQNPEPEYQPQYQQTQTYVLPGTMNFQSTDYQSADYQSAD
ncbi:hypothetical protein NQ314_009245 [Rhamnusium bicolor]|uniref:Uncharacterized protein n=1 Tax=Rhamnusium bicolor TaxID=1586634 RepID=A0AAV8Y463_9CUCU|nr:hypothetical protein NQ314_009245 [Rhamnusium bicolor]